MRQKFKSDKDLKVQQGVVGGHDNSKTFNFNSNHRGMEPHCDYVGFDFYRFTANADWKWASDALGSSHHKEVDSDSD